MRSLKIAAALALANSLAATGALSATFTTLYSFPAVHNARDGFDPSGSLVYNHGYLYGTTVYGGGSTQQNGVVYKFAIGTGKLHDVYRFLDTVDGHLPVIGLIKPDPSSPEHKELFYGTTTYGVMEAGAVFSINSQTGAFKVVHGFPQCSAAPCPTRVPYGLAEDHNILYGVGQVGGASELGTIFSVDPVTGAETDLYGFTGAGVDGETPQGSPIFVDGIMYGTTTRGGPANAGTLFSYDPATNKEKVLYSFPGGDGGSNPQGFPVYFHGSIYGVAAGSQATGTGLIYAYNVATHQQTVLRLFDKRQEGAVPYAGLTIVDGKIYGTTAGGGVTDAGTIFSITIATGKFEKLYDFDVAHGSQPYTPLLNVNGTLFGTASAGGTYNAGTIFSLKP